MEERIYIAGVGGQGAILTGKLACYSAIHSGKFASFLPTYGAAQRGGAAACTVVLSDEEILSPVVEKLDTLMVFSMNGLEHLPRLKEGGKLFINSSLVTLDDAAKAAGYKIFDLPADKLADDIGVRKVSNIVMLGSYAKNADVLALDDVLYALEKNLAHKPELLELNKQALDKGYSYS